MANELEKLINELKSNTQAINKLGTSVGSAFGLTDKVEKGTKELTKVSETEKSLFSAAIELASLLYPINQALQFQLRYTSQGIKFNELLSHRLDTNVSYMTQLEGAVELLTVGLEEHGESTDLLAARAKLLGENMNELLMDVQEFSNALSLNERVVDKLSNSLVTTAEVYRISTQRLAEALNSLREPLAAVALSTGKSGLGSAEAFVEAFGMAGRRAVTSAQNIFANLFSAEVRSFATAGMLGIEGYYQKFMTGNMSSKDLIDALSTATATIEGFARGQDPRILGTVLPQIFGVNVSMAGEMKNLVRELQTADRRAYSREQLLVELNSTLAALSDAFLTPMAQMATGIAKTFVLLNDIHPQLLTRLVQLVGTLSSMFALMKVKSFVQDALFKGWGNALLSILGGILGFVALEALTSQLATKELRKMNIREETKGKSANPYGFTQKLISDMIQAQYQDNYGMLEDRRNTRMMEQQNLLLEEISNQLRNMNAKTPVQGINLR